MEDTAGLLDEFNVEAEELLDEAEDSILSLEKRDRFKENYDAIFRTFHSLKGSAGMLDLEELQRHMHIFEDFLSKFSDDEEGLISQIDYFLKGIDIARKSLHGNKIEFDYSITEEGSKRIESSDMPLTSIIIFSKNNLLEKKLKSVFKSEPLAFFTISNSNNLESKIIDIDPHLILLDSDSPLPDEVYDLMKKYFSIATENCHADIILKSQSVISLESSDLLLRKSLLLMIRHSQLFSGFSKSLGLLMYQFSDLEEYLQKQNKTHIIETLKTEISSLMNLKSSLGIK